MIGNHSGGIGHSNYAVYISEVSEVQKRRLPSISSNFVSGIPGAVHL